MLRAFPLLAATLFCLSLAATQEQTPEQPAAAEPVRRADLTAANEMIRAQDYAAAEQILAALQQEFPDDARVLLQRGELLIALGRANEAIPVLQKSVAVEPERLRANFQLATALASTGDPEGALAAFGRELELNGDTQVRVLAGLNRSMLFEQEREWLPAATELEAVLAIRPDPPNAFGDLAVLYVQGEELDLAAEALERGRDAGFLSASHYYSLGARFYKAERYEEAIGAFERTLDIDPGIAPAERSLGAALEKLDRTDEAREHWTRYIELEPDAPDAAAVAERIRAIGGS